MTEQANKDSQKINEEVEMETDPQTQAAEPGENAEADRASNQNDDQQDSEVLVKKITEQTAEIEALKKKNDELTNRMLRMQADFDNFRKRTNKEKTDSRKFRAQDLVSDMLEILDNFQRALAVETTSEDGQSLKKGMEMVLSKLEDALKKEGVEEIPSLNQPFDPNVHQAVMQEESPEHESGTVIQVLQVGYTLNGRVIRPAMVKVSA
ncbi:nucleotide exchange factor GrpE [Sporolactobacillus inulinus]|uniref:Protein GrpE n=1 Tax=Sporolactobacillus inulinus CASD TaxID=1069536 RepID=A0A0U1QMX4_9BACL|nr:nucleotide exchange factor GrpE [Sporolactobacillus inulinus]KLI02160.1 molecular chaperone GrpE [Sporolactobacillus inulinus CASD]GEB76235.1 protein GrpE [Sporolactobacillus inulinus]